MEVVPIVWLAIKLTPHFLATFPCRKPDAWPTCYIWCQLGIIKTPCNTSVTGHSAQSRSPRRRQGVHSTRLARWKNSMGVNFQVKILAQPGLSPTAPNYYSPDHKGFLILSPQYAPGYPKFQLSLFQLCPCDKGFPSLVWPCHLLPFPPCYEGPGVTHLRSRVACLYQVHLVSTCLSTLWLPHQGFMVTLSG